MQEVTDFLLDLGITKVKWSVQEKALLVQVLCEHLAINRSKASLDQFVDGLKSVDMDFLETMKSDSLLFEKCSVSWKRGLCLTTSDAYSTIPYPLPVPTIVMEKN